MNITTKQKIKQNGSFLPGMTNLRFAGAKRLLVGAVAVLFLVGCDDDKEPNTSHPYHGAVTLTTDWTSIGDELAVPESYTVCIGDYTTTQSGISNKIDHLFEPGAYNFYIYNRPKYISVGSGTTATLTEMVSEVGGTGRFVRNDPEWLFTSAMTVDIKADSEHTVTAVMEQQVRELTLVIEPMGGISDMIDNITGYLSGVAGTLEFADGTHGTPSNVELQFTPITVIDQGTKWTATVRLLGISGTPQTLNLKFHFADGSPAPIDRQIDLTSELAGFNNDKRTPFSLNRMVELPTIPQ